MEIGLGVDTGSTFTDCVALDLSTRKILAKAKSPTTHHDLSRGLLESISRVLDEPHIQEEDVKLVSLSTTLATNAIVENKGGKAALLIIGTSPSEDWRFPAEIVRYVEGGHGPMGTEMKPLNLKKVASFGRESMDQVEAFAVSSFFGMRNNEHEMAAKKKLREITGLPVVCGSDLSFHVGLYERSVTAALNARLVSLIDELLNEVRDALAERGVKAPMMVVRGDGSLISEAVARERPVETVLSGPAASAVGGCFLSGKENAIVVDVGGTTTDIAVLENGFPGIVEEGSLVGGMEDAC